MIRKPSFLLAAVAVGSMLGVGPAGASNGNGLHWAGPGLRTVNVTDKTGSATWGQIVDRAVNSWNAGRTNVRLVRRTGSGPCSIGGGDIQVCLGGTKAGVAHWSYNGTTRHFNGAAIRLNGAATRYGDALMCHELGHTLGLTHRRSGEATCMTAAVTPGQTRPDQHDFDTVFAQGNH